MGVEGVLGPAWGGRSCGATAPELQCSLRFPLEQAGRWGGEEGAVKRVREVSEITFPALRLGTRGEVGGSPGADGGHSGRDLRLHREAHRLADEVSGRPRLAFWPQEVWVGGPGASGRR